MIFSNGGNPGLGDTRRTYGSALTLTLEEEKQTDRQLTEVTEQHIMPAALASDEQAEKEPSDRNKTSGGRAKAA